ncbi:hypothetical protein N7U66_00490 [Lacinutrix neustonica]|uniref:Uncharacterized protein n=1 Tax=Lacinutrix neustonica TaxID=2980107 RepID=A0A9E8MWM2_9FLAO|nr:hypothetical protein [Lacinutrix neustonica]WAC02290.1 hypothetical protein N7U66_00490 [Lacinutrix neustonica]
MKNIISYLLIAIGGAIAIYANANEKQNVLLLIVGIVTLMIGIYGLNRKLTSKSVEASKKNNQEEE